MPPAVAPRFVPDRVALDDLVNCAKQLPCPSCRRTGMLVGHGSLHGYAERENGREIRGRRFLCSPRFRRSGCGRTFSVLIATVFARFTVRTPTISALLNAVIGGLSRKVAWEKLAPGLSLRSVYRLWNRFASAQARIRTALCGLLPPPATNDLRPTAQLLAHLRAAFVGEGCVLARFQLAFQVGAFT